MLDGLLTTAVREKLEALAAEDAAIAALLASPEVSADHARVRDLSIRRSAIEPAVSGYGLFRRLVAEAADLAAAIEAGEDAELVVMAREELAAVTERAAATIAAVRSALASGDESRVGSVILEVRAGTGGDEAGLWARDLIDVYRRYGASRGWSFDEMELTAGGAAGGVRHAVLAVRGPGVYSEMSFEAGVHSVKRVPATETAGRVHTSTCTVAVLPEPTAVEVRIDWANDVVEHVTTAQGPGGQNVNKVATAVHMVHTPTGVEVRMQETKSQAQNRDKARRLLAARVHEIERRRVESERAAERRGQIGSGGRSEKIRVYRYQDNIVSDERLGEKFSKTQVIDRADLGPLFAALIEHRTAERLAGL